MKNKINRQKGFTLVEIMMVVIIIGILAVLAIPRYEKYTVESRLSEVAISVGEIKTGMEKYYNSHGNQYIWMTEQEENTLMEMKLRIDLGDQDNFMFRVETLDNVNGISKGYKITAFLTSDGTNDYGASTCDVLDRVIYFFPKNINSQYTSDPEWRKGWRDDDFFMDGQSTGY